MAKTPTQRTLEYYRKQGYVAAVVEKWNPHIQVRHDLFGFADVIAFDALETLLIQATSGSNLAARVKKLEANGYAGLWASGDRRRVIAIGWRKVVKRNKDGSKAKRKHWEPKIVEIYA